MHSDWTGPPKMIVLDIDGTLVAPGGRVTERVRSSLRRAHSAGCHMVLATGRASFEVVELFRETGLPDGFAVCSNGAVVAHMPRGDILSTEGFNAGAVVTTLLEHVPDAQVAMEVAGTGYLVTHRFPEDKLLGPQTVSDLETMGAQQAIRVVVRDPSRTREDFHTLIQRLHIRGASYAVGYEAWLDLGPLGVSKASGLEQVALALATNGAQALAIGDGLNDIEMIRWAGRGVAMGHAPQELRNIADHTTSSVFEDGVAAEIERWF